MSHAFHACQIELYPARICAQAVGFVSSFSRISAVISSFIIADLLKTSGDVDVFTFIAARWPVWRGSLASWGRGRLQGVAH